MKTTTRFFLSVVFALMAGSLFAQDVPSQIFYQGNLADAGGNPVNGEQAMIFSIWKSESSTDAADRLWDEAHSAVPVSGGLFSVALGSVAPLPKEVFSGAPRYLEVIINGETLSPRQRIVSVPYAFNAASLADSVVTGDKIISGQVVRSVNGLKDDVKLSAGANVIITPQGDSLVIAAPGGGSGSPWQLSGSNVYYSLGDVGIGIANPSSRLEVNGPITVTSDSSESEPVSIHFKKSGFRIMDGIGGEGRFLGLWGLNKPIFGANDSNFVLRDVNVYPVSDLTSSLGLNTRRWAEVYAGDGSFETLSANGTISAAAFEGDGSGLTNLPSSPWETAQNDVYYQNGKVGIGTESPSALVHSQSSGGVPSFLAGGSSADFAVPDNNQAMQFGQWDGSSAFTEWMRISPDGNVGIGTAAPTARLDIEQTAGLTQALAVTHSSGAVNVVSVDAPSGSGNGMQVLKAGGSGNGIEARQNGDGSAIEAIQWGDGPGLKIDNTGGTGNGTGLNINHKGSGTAIDVSIAGGSAKGFRLSSGSTGRALDIIGTTTSTVENLVNIQRTGQPATFEELVRIKTPSGTPATTYLLTGYRGTNLKYVLRADGNVFADGSFTGGGADFAEMIAVGSGVAFVEAGDVLVIDPANPRSVVKSAEPRSTLVAGIYSTKPGFVGSERDWDRPSGQQASTYTMADMAGEFSEIPMAVVGIVPCKVSGENGAIRPGDLLVTSSTPGHAMRDDDPRNGTIVGKALGSLSSGSGVINVLVTLQ